MRVTNTKPWWNEFCMKFNSRASIFGTSTLNKGEKVLVHHFVDWDTRRDYYVVTSKNFLLGMEYRDAQNRVWDALKHYLPMLSVNARLIMIDDDRRLQAVSSSPADLITIPSRGFNTLVPCFEWPQFEEATEFKHLPTINKSQMVEVDRMAPRVDIMEDTSRDGERVVAKWLLIFRAELTWREMLILNSIPAHPHIVPIHRIIVDDASNRILGWTSKYVDGCDLEIDKSQFKMKWLRQLIETLDYLHLELGITHGDLQLKNMMIDKAADKLLLIDFEEVCEITEKGLQQEFNQLMWSIYEIVTHDVALVEEQLYNPDFDEEDFNDDPRIINEMSEWPARTNLDCEPQEIRQYLQDWIQRRTAMPMTLPETALQLKNFHNFAQFRKTSPAVQRDREAREAKFDELQQIQILLQERKSALPVGDIRWERLPYTKAYPDKARNAIRQSQKRERKADSEEEEPQSKRTKGMVTMTPYTEDLESSEEGTNHDTCCVTVKLPPNYTNEARKKDETTEEISTK